VYRKENTEKRVSVMKSGRIKEKSTKIGEYREFNR
jgi:hypothetical protein